MVNPQPNKSMILAIAAAKSAHDIHHVIATHGASLAIEIVQWFQGITDNIEKACIIDFACRHGGLTLSNIAKYIGMAQTNRCSNCRWIGHNKNYCPN